MSKKYKDKTCVYCACAPSATADHVVAREFFPETHREGLPKVPACQPCNRLKSDLERRFTTVLPFGSAHEAAVTTLVNKGSRRLAKNPSLRRKLVRGMESAIVVQDGRPLSTIALPFDGDDFLRLCAYMIRGLVWSQWKYVVPVNYHVEAITLTDAGLPLFHQLLQKNPRNRCDVTLAHGALQYTCTCNSQDPAFSVWHIRFYEALNLMGTDGRGYFVPVHICGVTGPPEVKEIMIQLKRLGQPTAQTTQSSDPHPRVQL